MNRRTTVARPNHVRDEVIKQISKWNLIRDCLEGDQTIKSKTITYLPKPNATDFSPENEQRYKDYVQRAVFYNAVGQTFAGLMGQVFTKEPMIEIPDGLLAVVKDVDGANISLQQLARVSVGTVLPYGRAGLLTDYSATEGTITAQQLASGSVRPTIRAYLPWDIINWRYETDNNNKRILSLVVLKEQHIINDDGFSYTTIDQYRELRMIDGVYTVRLWRLDSNNKFDGSELIVPTYNTGKPFNSILFEFIGSENNTADVDKAPMYDQCVINIAHYINSADYEESVYLVGQPTPYVTGLSQSWVTEVLKGGFNLGSRTAVPLPTGATAGMLVAQENGLVKEAMDHKERQMVAFGAKLVEQRSVQRTATEAGLEASAENSTLVSVSRNVSNAIVKSLEHCCKFLGIEPTGIKFELNTDFAISKLSPEEQKAAIFNYQSGAISWDEMRIILRKGNLPLMDDKIAKTAIDAEQETKQNAALELASKTKLPTDKPINKDI
jgi:hypothetical protein